MPRVKIDPQKCTQCGACVAVCPVRILRMTEEGPVLPSPDAVLCIECGHCVAVCPHAALNHSAMAAADCPTVEEALRLSPEQVEQFLRSRRSIRRYREEPVEPGLLARLLRLATYAPSGHNSQPVEWVVMSGGEKVRALADNVLDWMRRLEREQPQVFQSMRMDRILAAAARGEDRVLRGAPHLVVAHAPKDNRFAPAAAVTALAYLELAAPSLGVGTCWAGYFTAAAATLPRLQEALALPEGHVVLGGAMVGYPAVRYARLPLRREPRITWR